jgi:serine/threonine-protein kinase
MITKKFYNILFFLFIFFIIFFMSAIVSSQLVLKGEAITIPKIIGKTLEEAKTELDRKRLSVVKKGEQFDNYWRQGKIIFQDPAPGSKVKPYKDVKVIVSAGSEMIIIPRLTGKNFETINQALSDASLRRGKISHVHNANYSAGKILAQFPSALEEAGRNFRVSLLVSQGGEEEKYLMPDLIGKEAETMIVRLKEMGFNVADKRQKYYPHLNIPGIITNQTPQPGFPVQKNTPITLEVSK